MYDVSILKLLAALAVFVAAMVGGGLPLMASKEGRSKAFLFYGDFFARGIFIGAAFIHLLPDAMDIMREAMPAEAYPITFAVCAFTIFAIQFIEQGVLKVFHYRAAHATKWIPYLLMVLLSIHSFIAGGALGVSETVGHIIMIFIAIMAHKGAAAFALGMSMRKAHILRAVAFRILFLFAVMTPLGILLGGVFVAYSQAHAALFYEALFNAIAAGTFIYIATFHHSELQVDESLQSSLAEIVVFGLGILVMALVAIWL